MWQGRVGVSLLLSLVPILFAAGAAQAVTESQKLFADDPTEDDYYGHSVAVSGETAVVGAYAHDMGSDGFGSVYVYERIAGVWTLQQKLISLDDSEGDRFGYSVSISGNMIAIGAPWDNDTHSNSGSVYIFERRGSLWKRLQRLTASDRRESAEFGRSISMSGDTLFIGAHHDGELGFTTGAVYVFTLSRGVWSQQQKLNAHDISEADAFGMSVSVAGDTAVVGVPRDDGVGEHSGSAYIFERKDGVWGQRQKLTASDTATDDEFGICVSISDDTILVGSHKDDDVLENSGSAYVFVRDGSVFKEKQKLTGCDIQKGDLFGTSVALSGELAVIGSLFGNSRGRSGNAFLFRRSHHGLWGLQAKFISSDTGANDWFGNSVSIAGDTAIVGAPKEGRDDYGSAYVFNVDAGSAEGEGEEPVHSADWDENHRIGFSELLRVIQLFNSAEIHCDAETEDRYAPGPGDKCCRPHDGDYGPQDWEISLREILRVIQFVNSGGYFYCPDTAPPTDDWFCPGAP